MDSQSGEHDINDLINVMFQDELQYFNASFDIIKNEVIPSITLSLESLKRAEQEYRNGQQIRESRLETINQNANSVTSIYFSPGCKAIQEKISKYYQFADEEFEQLLISLDVASASAQNMMAFQSVWQSYEEQLQKCISKPSTQKQQGKSQTP